MSIARLAKRAEFPFDPPLPKRLCYPARAFLHRGIAVAKPKGLSRSDLEIAYSGPAKAANRFYVSIGVGGMRIAFAEQHDPDMAPKFRTAVLLPMPDALALRDLLNGSLQNVRVESSSGQTVQ